MISPKTRPCLLLAAIAILVAASAARADSSLFWSVNFPVGDFADATTAGWSLGGFATGDVLPSVDVGAYVAYSDFVVDISQPGVGTQLGSSLNAWELEALGQIDIAFLKGFLGLGVANYSGRNDAGDSERKTDFAWQVGAAAAFAFLEGRLSYHQINAGVNVGWIGLSVGILF